jgi:hypothetical protein
MPRSSTIESDAHPSLGDETEPAQLASDEFRDFSASLVENRHDCDREWNSMNESARSRQAPAYVEFRTALLRFSEVPSEANLVRYLHASRVLEELGPIARRPTRPASPTGRRSTGSKQSVSSPSRADATSQRGQER